MLVGLGTCPVKIMILEVRFLLTNFDSTSAIFKTLYLALNNSENCRGGGEEEPPPVRIPE